jgi:probable rRNA maturation factor
VIEVDVTGPAIRSLPRREIAAFVRTSIAALRRARALDFAPAGVDVVFVGDREMRRLNRTWRSKSSTTDVLTFPADASYADDESGARPLGDIVISVDQAKRQARDEGHSLATEIRYLILHGLIHAIGYDHEADEGEMDALELKIRQRVGLA